MDSDEELRRLLAGAAQSYEPATDGATRVLKRTGLVKTVPRRRFPPRRQLQIAGGIIAAVALLTGIGFAVGGRGTGVSSSSSSAVGGAPAASGQAPKSGGVANGIGGTSDTTPQPASRIVQTGQVSLEVKTGLVQASLDRLASIATGAGGYLSDTKSSTGSGVAYGSSTLRIPVARFASVLIQVRRVGHVESISSQAQDVSAQYVDLGARLSALTQTRATYLTLQSRTTTIGDALAVQAQIQTVQTQIEQLQGQQKVLADSSDLATLAVSVAESDPTTVAVSHPPPSFRKAWHQAVSGFTTGLKVIIRIAGPALLMVLVLAPIALGGLFSYRRLRRRHI